MGIYIKGMEMPKACLACPCFDEKDYVCKAIIKMLKKESIYHYRPEWCPLVAVPPHGRLIDADAVFDNLERTGWYDNADRDIAEDLVLDASTIIPAEEAE